MFIHGNTQNSCKRRCKAKWKIETPIFVQRMVYKVNLGGLHAWYKNKDRVKAECAFG